MSSELPLTGQAQRHVHGQPHMRAVRDAFERPVSKHPTDDDMAVIGSVLGRKRGSVQTFTGADGTWIRVAIHRGRPARIIYVSPLGGTH